MKRSLILPSSGPCFFLASLTSSEYERLAQLGDVGNAIAGILYEEFGALATTEGAGRVVGFLAYEAVLNGGLAAITAGTAGAASPALASKFALTIAKLRKLGSFGIKVADAIENGNLGSKLAKLFAPRSVDRMAELGQLGGELFPAEKIPALVKYLDQRGIYLHEGVNGSFDGVRGIMTLPKNPTKLNVRHELAHMLDYKKYGDAYYKLFTPAQREQMVLDRLKNNRLWDQLNDLEREWSLNYPSRRE